MTEFFTTVKATPHRKHGLAWKLTAGPLLLLLCSLLVLILGLVPLVMAGAVGIQAAVPVTDAWKAVPSELPEVAIAQRNVLLDKNGAPLATLWTENRAPLKSISQVSTYAVHGLLDTEDKNFYSNRGYDPMGMARAAVKGTGGGSGITQQLVKNLQYFNLLGKDKKQEAIKKSYGRKLSELKMAMEYERTHSKDQILLDYFNTVAFGGPTIYGIETASQYFFGKPAKNLTLAEAAALAGSAQNANIYNLEKASTYPKWKARQGQVLDRMVAMGHITKQEATQAKAQKLNLLMKKSSSGTCYTSKYPFYCKYVTDYLMKSPRLGSTTEERTEVLARGGLVIKTHMDPAAMATVESYLKGNWGVNNRIIAPTALVEPGTGGVVAMGANRDMGNGAGKTTLVLPNQPAAEGSVYKIFMLATALTQGGMDTQDLTFPSLGCPLRPGRNYDAPPGGFRNSSSCKLQGGLLNYKQATAYSSNTWYVTLEMRVGVEKLKEFSKSVGLAAPSSIGPRSLSYTLGPVENSPIALAAAFATFSNKGVYCPPTPVSSIALTSGDPLPYPDSYNPAVDACRSVMSPHAASVVLQAMRANLNGEVPKAFGIRSNVPGYDNGGKSGTNESYNSTWAHLTGQYSLFTNVYDMTQTSRGIDDALFKGVPTPWTKNTAQTSGGEMMALLLRGKANKPLDWNNMNTSRGTTVVDESNFFLMPTVSGLSKEAALQVLKNAGVTAHVDKITVNPPPGYSSGVVVKQSLAPGTRLAKGTKREVTLTVSS